MKTLTKIFGIVILSSTLLFTMPVMAQNAGNDATTTTGTTHDNEHDDSGKWGLLGLLGLAGLLGLRRKDDDRNRTTINR